MKDDLGDGRALGLRPEPPAESRPSASIPVADKWVRVMCDYTASGLWDREGAGIGVSEVPISTEIAWELGAWQTYYDLMSDDHEPKPEWVKGGRKRHAEWGLRIAEDIKAELPDWTVVYFDEMRCRFDGSGQPRHEFEYEVAAQGIEARRAETGTGSVHESPVAAGDAPGE